MRTSKLTHALKKWARLWGIPELPAQMTVSFSPRLRKSLGQVLRRSGRITLNSRLADAPRAFLQEVLCHEVAHVAVFLLHGSKVKPHGPEWKELVRAAGYQPTTSLDAPWIQNPSRAKGEPEAPGSRRHHYRCPVCQADYFVRRRNSRLRCDPCLSAGLEGSLRYVPHA